MVRKSTMHRKPFAADWQVTSFSPGRLSIILTETDASAGKTDRIVEMVKIAI